VISLSETAVIILNQVSKQYKLILEKQRSLKETFIKKLKRKSIQQPKIIPVLKNFSLKVYKGEVLGVIGENGVGKSTILKLISGILIPDEGTITVRGSIAALLEIGLGFHPDLTGRENARLYGSILGFSRKTMDEKMNEIFGFAELNGFEDIPIKRYSSGMQVRLAFSVATMVDPDILLLDEVFSVGDQRFQTKSFEKIQSLINSNKTVILVTHDLNIVNQLCTRVMFIQRGGKALVGETKEMITLYQQSIHQAIH
jgi:ABC-2 type transport system ATP-binding protein